MPIFEYKCNSCKYKFELLRSGSDESIIICPKCGNGDVARLFSAFASNSSGSTSNNCGGSGGFS